MLNGLLMRAKELGIIKGVKVGRNKVYISHLQFADDSLFSSLRLQRILSILEEFLTILPLCLALL